MAMNRPQDNLLSITESIDEEGFDVLVVGAGPAGLGVGVALKHAGVSNFQILDRETVGASFEAWPRGMQLITPSFPANSIGMLDLNSIAIGTSPGFSLSLEHPSGGAYAAYLRSVAEYFELPTRSQTEVYSLQDTENGFELDTSAGTLRAKHIVWATGEFQFPNIPDFEGAELGTHNSRVSCWSEIAKLGRNRSLSSGATRVVSMQPCNWPSSGGNRLSWGVNRLGRVKTPIRVGLCRRSRYSD